MSAPANEPDPLLKVLLRLKVRPALNAPWLPCEDGYRGICPLCKTHTSSTFLDILGPRDGKLSARPRCEHTLEQILASANLEPDDLYEGDASGDPLPELMPRLPNRAEQWSEADEREARHSQFLRQLPAPVPDLSHGLLAQVAEALLGPLQLVAEAALKDLRDWNRRGGSPWQDDELLAALQEAHERTQHEAYKTQTKGMAEATGLRLVSLPRFTPRRLRWLVEGVLVANQAGVLGGPRKSLKTNLSLDLAISLATGRPFLGTFAVPRPVRVAVFSGESGEEVLDETARRIARSKGLSGTPAGVFLCPKLPQLARPSDLEALRVLLEEVGAELVLIDPLYLCLTEGGDKKNPANLFEMGPLLHRVADTCLGVGCTPVLIHHATKEVKPGKPMDLKELAFAGIQEFARQWLLLNRRKPYNPHDPGRHQLLLAYGGSAGHGGLRVLDVREGTLQDDFSGRTWDITVATLEEARHLEAHDRQEVREAKQEQKDRKKERVQEDEDRKNAARLLEVIGKLSRQAADGSEVVIQGQARDVAGLTTRAMNRALFLLKEDGEVEEAVKEVIEGKRARKVAGLKLRLRPGTNGTGHATEPGQPEAGTPAEVSNEDADGLGELTINPTETVRATTKEMKS